MLGPKTDRGLPEDGPPGRGDIFWKALLLHSILLMVQKSG